jgi:hypothetical protein
MPRRSSARSTTRTPVGLIVLSVFVIGSLTLGAIVSIVDPVVVSTPTQEIFLTVLPLPQLTQVPEPTATEATPTPPQPAIGPAVAPTQ